MNMHSASIANSNIARNSTILIKFYPENVENVSDPFHASHSVVMHAVIGAATIIIFMVKEL